mmetsp:Transcript_126016/g.251554  ORF Transcript_126016/g.251554 Transcript_126016/m.251554 type:complete len:1282 (+) Transcript_126016:49-3894(+)
MGCCSSKDADLVRRIEDLDSQIAFRPWRTAAGQFVDTKKLEQCVQELVELHSHSAAGSKRTKIQRLSANVGEEIKQLLDIKLFQRRDLIRIQCLLRLSRDLDAAAGKGVAAKVQAKYKALCKQSCSELLKQAGVQLQRIVGPESLVEGAKQVLSTLQHAQTNIAEAPELATSLLQYATAFSVKILELIRQLVDLDPQGLLVLQGVADGIDMMCAQATKTTDGIKWEPFSPKVDEISKQKAIELMPAKLESLEIELAKKHGMSRLALMEKLSELSPLWIEPAAEMEKRLAMALTTIEERITEAFDKAIAAGETNKIDKLIEVSLEYDDHCSIIVKQVHRHGAASTSTAAERDSLGRVLERKRANVTLKTLLANAEGSINKRTAELRELFRQTNREIKKIPRESLFKKAENAKWSFRLMSGNFKEFDDTKNAEVEKKYQAWVRAGKPREEDARRIEISIEVDAASLALRSSQATRRQGRRPKCRYGEKCYRKNVEHRKEFSHPTDNDWDDETFETVPEGLESTTPPIHSMSSDAAGGTRTTREERYKLDFQMMTQVRLTSTGVSAARRLLKRNEGMTVVQKHNHEYYKQIIDFVKELESIFEQVEVEMRLLGNDGRSGMEKQVDQLLKKVEPALREFLDMAVYCKDKESLQKIDDIEALLGVHVDRIGLAGTIRGLRLDDMLGAIKAEYSAKEPKTQSGGRRHACWDLLRLLCKPQAVGPPRLLECRLALVGTKREHEQKRRLHLTVKCQGLLYKYENDADFLTKFRAGVVEILSPAARKGAENCQHEAVLDILWIAIALKCDVGPVVKAAGSMVTAMINSACNSRLQPLTRVTEVLDIGHHLAHVAKKPLHEFSELDVSSPLVANRVLVYIEQALLSTKESEAAATQSMPATVRQVVEVRQRFRNQEVLSVFDDEFWRLFKPWYQDMTADAGDQKATTNRSGLLTEWAIAYCEQLQLKLPPWMMNKDQVEALRQLQAAVDANDEKKIREAVVFAKQADYTSDEKLAALFDSSIEKLRKLKRLPSGWEVEGLVGDSPAAKMFCVVNLGDEPVKALFQKIFNDTKASIVTRDRVGAVPRGYTVEQIISVMNAESWGSYLKRVDVIGEECKKFPGASPCSRETWAGWSGAIATQPCAEAILQAVRLPALQANANEFLMFHGTKPEAANLIAQNHFDMSFACKTGLFGAGLYFAESCSKSDEYVKADKEDRFPVVMCRVTLGHINYVPHKDPTKDPGREKLESSCLTGEYHSVLGDRKKAKGTYREFVVYNHYQVYPHFIVWYKRV